MQSISSETADAHNLIRFRTLRGQGIIQDAFFLADGQKIRLTSGYDGTVQKHICKYLDPHHVQVSNAVFHIDQFAALNAQNGNLIEPEIPLTDLSLYPKKYLDRSLCNHDGQPVPYHELVHVCDAQTPAQINLRIAVCPQADEARRACIVTQVPSGSITAFLSLNLLQRRLYQDLYSELDHWDRQLLDALLREKRLEHTHPSLSGRIEHVIQQMQAKKNDLQQHMPKYR